MNIREDVIYARQSVDRKDSISIESQIDFCKYELKGGSCRVFKDNPKITAYQVELAQVEAEIEKLLDTLTGANATLLTYANKKIEDLDNRRKTLSKAIADLSVETLSSQQIELLSGYLDDWENISFEDKRKAADGLISSISATSDYVKIEWKI